MVMIDPIQHIKNQSYEWSNQAKKDGFKLFSVSKILGALEKPKDWDQIAMDCHIRDKDDPSGKYHGMSAEEIKTSWFTKSKKGANRGNILDDYIAHHLHQKPFESFLIDNADQETQQKIEHFKDMWENHMKPSGLVPVGNELWVVSNIWKTRGRLDELFMYNGKFLIVDWKNTENIKKGNPFEKLLGPCEHLDNCEWVKYTLQIYLYRFFLNTEYGVDVFSGRICQIRADGWKIWKPAFPYDEQMIKEILEWSITKILTPQQA